MGRETLNPDNLLTKQDRPGIINRPKTPLDNQPPDFNNTINFSLPIDA